jgi:hypothetical protein
MTEITIPAASGTLAQFLVQLQYLIIAIAFLVLILGTFVALDPDRQPQIARRGHLRSSWLV